MTNNNIIKKIVSLSKRRGIIFQNSEIYGGINGFWDYGPIGVTIKRLIESIWWKNIVETRENIVGLDSTIINNPNVWSASGHLDKFNDLMIDCKNCKSRFKSKIYSELDKNISEKIILCPICGSKDILAPRKFNLMMKTYIGSLDNEKSDPVYLRSETCQSIFMNFDIIKKSSRQSIPFGIAQIGKAFRNEINPRNFIYRTREFTQMELEFFCFKKDAKYWYNFWINERLNFYNEIFGYKENNLLKLNIKNKNDLSHYATESTDIEYKYPFGWGELESINNRGIWDISRHNKFSNKKIECLNSSDNSKFIPTVIETSVGVDRIILSLLANSYKEEIINNNKRIILKLPLKIVPIQIAIFPLCKKLEKISKSIYFILKKDFRVMYDDTGSIGRRYRRQDEIGTPFCITIDFNTNINNIVTIRERDSMLQDSVSIEQLKQYFDKKFI